ncbi:hypothetical protein [Thalassobellus sediminis]|uniref:hypothetical protein n=1 Tax=Thalassobellus sediminis TaxID=3367753 RepID=UPI0037ADFFA7
MRYYILLITTLFFFSCGKGKTVQLPEISHSEISEINDVSAAYLFYDETQKDSVELNRKNLISTTNWLFNVDKRLTLKQAIPHIKFLQEKKQNSSHKNENSKNYFTCNDTSKKNLGFIEFTDVVYHKEPAGEYFTKISDIPKNVRLSITFSNKIEIMGFMEDLINKTSTKDNLINDLKDLFSNKEQDVELILNFSDNLSFQDYITYKSLLSELDIENLTIIKDEFIY